jgi:hypothetical protein
MVWGNDYVNETIDDFVNSLVEHHRSCALELAHHVRDVSNMIDLVQQRL